MVTNFKVFHLKTTEAQNIPSPSTFLITDIKATFLPFFFPVQVTDFTPPECQLLNIQSNCTENCSLSTWEISVRVTDRDAGTGVERVSLRQGNGTLKTSLAVGNKNITLASYTASCCLPDVELLVVDRVGNVGSCIFNARDALSAAISVSTNQSLLLYLTVLILGLMLTEVRTD